MSNTESRKFAIKVIGFYSNHQIPKSNYTVIVPYSNLSKTLKQIQQKGCKIIDVIDLNMTPLEVWEINSIKSKNPQKEEKNIELSPLPLFPVNLSSKTIVNCFKKTKNKRKSRFNKVKSKQSKILSRKKSKYYVLG